MRKFAVALGTVAALVPVSGSAVAAPTHLHCLTTPNGNTHAIAQGVTYMAPHETAFHNLHGNVHVGVFMLGNHPLSLAADTTAPFTCPPSP